GDGRLEQAATAGQVDDQAAVAAHRPGAEPGLVGDPAEADRLPGGHRDDGDPRPLQGGDGGTGARADAEVVAQEGAVEVGRDEADLAEVHPETLGEPGAQPSETPGVSSH